MTHKLNMLLGGIRKQTQGAVYCLLTHKSSLCCVYVLVVKEDGVNRGEEV